MKTKVTKTTLMKLNFTRNQDFPPEIKINGFKNNLQVVEKAKLVGLTITNDLFPIS